jgi:hypothetical protein
MRSSLERRGWTVQLLGSKGRGRLVATRADLPALQVQVDYKHGFDAHAAWRVLDNGREVANNYTAGDLLPYLEAK